MPTITKLRPEEVQEIQNKGKSQRQLIAEQYDAMLEGFTPGDWGMVTLDETDVRTTVRNRLRAAAQRKRIELAFKRSQGDAIRFQVVELGQGSDEEDEELGAEPTQEAVYEFQQAAEKAVPEPVGTDTAPLEVAPKRRGGRRKKAEAL